MYCFTETNICQFHNFRFVGGGQLIFSITRGLKDCGVMSTEVSPHSFIYFLEQQDLLYPLNEHDIYVLHYAFVPQINYFYFGTGDPTESYHS